MSQRDVRRKRLIARITPEVGHPFHVAHARVSLEERRLRATCTLKQLESVHQLLMKLFQRLCTLDSHPHGVPSSTRTRDGQMKWLESGNDGGDPIERLVDLFALNEVLRESDVWKGIAAQQQTLRLLPRELCAQLDRAPCDLWRWQDGYTDRDRQS